MYRNDLPLPDIITGKDYIISYIDTNVKHLFKFGFHSGVKIKKVLISPSGNPCAYELMGTIIAVRNEDAALIYARMSD